MTLLDPVPAHADTARARGIEAHAADTRLWPTPDAGMDAVLLMGLFHLAEFGHRLAALREARRVLRPAGVIVTAALSRWARAFVRAAAGDLADPTWHQRTLTTMRQGHLPDGDEWDRHVYLHDPQELALELRAAGFHDVHVIGVEGPAGPWARQDPGLNQHAIELARATDTALAGASIHMLATGVNHPGSAP